MGAGVRSGNVLRQTPDSGWVAAEYVDRVPALGNSSAAFLRRERHVIREPLDGPVAEQDDLLVAERLHIRGVLPERMLDWYEQAIKEDDYRPIGYAWWPMPAAVRRTERFKKLVRDAGLVDYWRAHGWPDLCRPVGDDFACD